MSRIGSPVRSTRPSPPTEAERGEWHIARTFTPRTSAVRLEVAMLYSDKVKVARGLSVFAVVFLAVALGSRSAAAQEIGEREPIENNSGPGASARPSAHFPSRGSMGLAFDADVTYGLPKAPVVVAPGGRFAAYFGGNGAVTGMPIVEVMLPMGPIVPSVKAGMGIGHATGPNESGLALMAGGGLDIHLTRDVLVGVDATYETVTGAGFNSLAIGPRATLRY